MNRKLFLFISMTALLALVLNTGGPALASPAAGGGGLTGYYNLMGVEGIGTLGAPDGTHGATPPIGDYGNRICRYIDVTNTTIGQYYLRYPLHLPNGSTITYISLYVADFNSTGVLWAYLRTRPWNSAAAGTTPAGWFTLSDNTTNSNKTLNISPAVGVLIDNQTTEYWIDVTPVNGVDPGQLCVYGIQVTVAINGAFLPLIQKGG